MAGITLDQAEAKLSEYLTAETAVTSGQAYSIGDRSLTRANLKDIRDGISFWEAKVQKLSRSGRGVMRIVPE